MGNTDRTAPTTAPASNKGPVNGTRSSIVEPRPISDPGGGEDIFLSPRVLDAGAFARYSEMLRSIIAQASTQGRTLEDFSADAEAMIKRCEGTGETINKRLQAGIRMLKMIDERAVRTDELLGRVQSALPDSEAMAERIDGLIEERMNASRERLDAMVAQAEARAQAAEERARRAAALSEEHGARLDQIAGSIDAQLARLDEKITAAQAAQESAGAELGRRAAEARGEIDAAIERAQERARETAGELDSKVDNALDLTGSRLADLEKSIEPVLEASSRAMRSLGMDPENPVFEDSPLARIEQLVDRGETQLASLDRVYRQLEDLQSQAEGVRSAFGEWLVSAADQLDTLEARKERIAGPVSEAVRTINELGPDLEDKLEMASTRLSHLQIEQKTLRQTIEASSGLAGEVSERLTNHSGQLQALLDGSLHKLSTRVEQAGVWLGALIQRAESLGGTLPGAGTMHFDRPKPRNESTPNPQPVPQPQQAAAFDQSAGQSRSVPTDVETNNGTEAAADETVTDEATTDDAWGGNETPVSFTIPRPPQLPIDGLSFDGADRVIEHRKDDEGQDIA